MKDERKTKAQLAEELADLRLQVADLRQREARASEAEEALRKASEEKSLILSSVSEEVIYHDRDMGIVWANRAAAESSGLRLDQLAGRMCYEVWHGRKQMCEGCPVQKAMDTGSPAETEITTPDGRVWHIGGYPVLGDGGQVVGAVEVARDITERRRAEQVLRENEQFLRDVFNGIEDGITVRDRDLTLLRVNRWIEQMFANEMPVVGKKCYRAFHNRDEPCPWCVAIKTMETGNVLSGVVFVPLAGGTGRWVELTVFPLRDAEGEIVGAIEHVKDVTDRKRVEDALRESEARYRAVVETQTEMVVRFLPGGTLTFANEAYCRYFGTTPEETTGANFLPFIPDEDRREVVKHLASITPEEPVAEHEHRMVLPDGEVRWMHWINRGISDDQGGLVEFQATGHDITERRRAEEALRRSEENYRAIFNAVGDVLFVHDIETGDVVDFNQKAIDVYGYTHEEIDRMNQQFRQAADPPYSYEDQIHGLRRAADQGPQLFEWLATDRNGRRFWVEISLRRATIGGRDRILAVLRDISDRKQAEEALRRSEENYRALFEQSLDGIVVVADGRVAGANQAFADIHRTDLKDVLGMPIAEFMYPDERERALANIRRVLEGRAERGAGRGRRSKRADGTLALIDILIKRIDWEGRPAVLAIIRDVTERTRLEEDLRQALKMEAVGQLAGGIAHDFGNLMTGILCHAELLKTENPSTEDVREAADLIEGAAQRATELTSQLLGFARRGKRQDAAVDLNATVETSVRLLSRSLDSRVHVGTRFCDEQAFVRGDPVQMEQVVLNLAMNARDAMPDGGNLSFITQTVDVRAEDCDRRPGAQTGRYVVLSVEDTGCGIPVATRGRVFEPFYTTKPQGKGTGMGLAMVYGIVKDHGGWVEVTSEAGSGTAFRVFLPEAEPPADLNLNAPPDAGPILADDEELEGR